MFGFLTAVSGILAAGMVTIAVILVARVLRDLVADPHTQKTRRRKFSGDDQSESPKYRQSNRVDDGSPFYVLGFKFIPNNFGEIRSAFLRESSRTHPDSNPDDPTAAHRFDLVKKAYEQIGTPDLFHNYLLRNPPGEMMLTTDGGEAEILSVEQFASSFVSLRAKWERAEAQHTAELERRLLGEHRRPKTRTTRPRLFSRSRPKPVLIDDVIFSQSTEFPQAKFFKVFDRFIRVDKKESFYQAIRVLLSHNGFKDTFSDVKGHSNSVTIIGDLPGAFIFPRPVKVLISHEDQPQKLFTRLWDLGLYRGPKVRANVS